MTSRGRGIPDMVAAVLMNTPRPAAGLATTRFAPSPNGPLHLGHGFAAIVAHDVARALGGRFLLRIEDIDGTRSRAEHVRGIVDDIAWLGLTPDAAPVMQSRRVAGYRDALNRLIARGLAYPCTCSRADIVAAVAAQPRRHGPDGPIYPGTCRDRPAPPPGAAVQWRLRMDRAVAIAGPLTWRDLAAGVQHADPGQFGDIVLWRKDAPASYHLAATLDDAADGITHIVRGMDLFAYSALHRLLQRLLNLPEPLWWHHPVLLDLRGDKLAKRRGTASLRDQGGDGAALAGRIRRLDFPSGITLAMS